MTDEMRTVALIVTTAASLALSGCGSGSKPPSPGPPGHGPPSQEPPHAGTVTFTAPTTTTIAKPQTGTIVRCTSHGVAAGAVVPAPGHGVSGSADGTSSSATIELTRKNDGSLVVSCTR
jgi:hypothetical protein